MKFFNSRGGMLLKINNKMQYFSHDKFIEKQNKEDRDID